MGWEGVHKPKGVSAKTFLLKLLSTDLAGEVLDLAMKGNVGYAAYKSPKGPIYALVIPTRRKTKDYFNFWYKIESEDMGPYEYSCPERILSQLGPPPNKHAEKWRAKNRERMELEANLPLGSVVKFKFPVNLRSGTYKTAQVVQKKGRSWILRTPDGLLFKMTPALAMQYGMTIARLPNWEILVEG